ncbi:type 4a pilus biogenesis protein PilO [Zhongshania sp.]|uniref:type 4a pilus biogenesis protein PilO n=1 Tax=Zhongshania sp. TaxID=1971902 RepID=UPI0035642A38
MNRDDVGSLDPRSIRLLGGGLALLLVAALSLYVVKPLWLNYQSIKASNLMLVNAMTHGVDLDQQLAQRYANIKSIEESLFGSSGAIPAKQMEGYVIGVLQSISWQQQVKLDSVRPLASKDIMQFRELPFEVSFSGDYFSLFNCLQAINKELGFIVIDQLTISSDPSDRSGSALQMKLRMASYRIIN